MPLNWSIENVKDFKVLTESDDEKAITQGIVWASMVYDLGKITAENVDEWVFRQEFVLSTEGWAPICRWPEGVEHKDGPVPPMRLTRAHFERRIGLRTNVSDIPRPRWLNKRRDKLADDAKNTVRLLTNAGKL